MGILSGSDIERIGNYINKSNLSLDEFVGGKLICKGFVGTKFTITSISIVYSFGSPIEVTITENSKQYQNSDVVKYETVLVPLESSTSIRVQYEDYDISMTTNFSYPRTHIVSYNLEKTIFESDVAGTYSLDVPANVTALVVSAVGGGGGGRYALSRSSDKSGDGGQGGSGGSFILNSAKDITSPATVSITVGEGGSGGVVNRANNTGVMPTYGGSTLISGGGVGITLAGGGIYGALGGVGKLNSLKEVGTTGTKGYSSGDMVGGDGGKGGDYGSTTSGGGGGAGGAGSPFGVGGNGGNGGDGTGSSSTPTYYGRPGYNGTRGSGGGGGGGTGGSFASAALGGDGGKGGDGYVLIKSRIIV